MRNLYLLFLLLLLNIFKLPAQTKVSFVVTEVPEEAGKNVGIRGNTAPLDWGKSIPLKKTEKGYSVTLDFVTGNSDLEFKFVRYTDDTKPEWEGTQNRVLALVPDTALYSENRWDQEQVIDVQSLPLLSPDALLTDFELIKTMVLEVHPGTYRYNSEAQIAKALEELQKKLSMPLTYGEAYLAMSKLTAQIKCDHTKPGFNNQGKIINSVIHYQKDKVPFTFKWVNDKMIVVYDASENKQLARGSEIVKINGIACSQILKDMSDYIAADGATDGNRRYKMEVNGYDFRYNAFDIFFPLIYPLQEELLTLEVIAYGQTKAQTIAVKPLTRDERSKILAERYPEFPKTRDDLWDFKLLENKVGLLTLNSFGLFGWKSMTIDYKKYLADVFDKLAKENIGHLIIDIRKNTGGADEMAIELSSYLTASSYQIPREGRTRYLSFPESLKPYVQTWGDKPWYFELSPEQPDPVNGYYSFPEEEQQKKNYKNRKAYKGKVYLLTSAANTSLAFYTAYRFKEQKLGPLIGQETGGNLNDINGGQILFLRLPGSQIEIDFPVMGGFMLKEQPNTGVRPDYQTAYTQEDIYHSRDLELATALTLIRLEKK